MTGGPANGAGSMATRSIISCRSGRGAAPTTKPTCKRFAGGATGAMLGKPPAKTGARPTPQEAAWAACVGGVTSPPGGRMIPRTCLFIPPTPGEIQQIVEFGGTFCGPAQRNGETPVTARDSGRGKVYI